MCKHTIHQCSIRFDPRVVQAFWSCWISAGADAMMRGKPRLCNNLITLVIGGAAHETPEGMVSTLFSDRQCRSPVRKANETNRFRNGTINVTKTAPESESDAK
jgi:hypothetical protein